MNDNSFYRAFEDRHRGSRDLIKSRLEVYRPFVEPLLGALPTRLAIDLGCGRGEWLELAQEIGFEAFGVDLDDGMLQSTRDLGLAAENHEALAFLASQADNSVAVLSGFHIVEHISFVSLQQLVQEALRVLAPGGLLILETPNPENVVVGSSKFYLDPTHERPIPPELLSFLPEHYGFAKVKVMRLQEAPDIGNRDFTSLLDVLEGASPDYAVVAQKGGNLECLSSTEHQFQRDFGIDLGTLARKYDQQTSDAVDSLSRELHEAAEGLRTANAELQELRGIALEARELAKGAEGSARAAHAALEAVHASRSWRLTAPLRWLTLQLLLVREHGLRSRMKAAFLRLAAPPFRWVAIRIATKPRLRRAVAGILQRLGVYVALRRILHSAGSPHATNMNPRGLKSRSLPSRLTPRARQIYADLCREIKVKPEQH